MRVGIGFDAHAFAAGRKLIIGGVELPHRYGLLGHSDADVLVHAVMDALLGASALGDLGKYFPPTEPKYKDISSLRLLSDVRASVAEAGFRCVNVDSVVVLEEPKLAPYVDEMRRNIGGCLEVDPSAVSVKATTTEGLGFTGRSEGVAAWACALLESI